MNAPGITLDLSELEKITGLTQPAAQVKALKAAGFWRARLNARHEVVLERAHHDAVCAGAKEGATLDRPRIRPLVPAT